MDTTRHTHDAACEIPRPVGDTFVMNGCDCSIRERNDLRASRLRLAKQVIAMAPQYAREVCGGGEECCVHKVEEAVGIVREER